MPDTNPTTNYEQSGGFTEEATLNIAAYMFAGLAMMLNIRLSYSAAPYALIRFKLPENLFSVFVRTTSSALELWCLPSMLLGNIMEQVYNHTQNMTGVHSEGIINKATDLKKKAGTIKSAAESQSTNELADSKKYDIQGNNKHGSRLPNNAESLRNMAESLKTAAEALRAAASGPPLATLQGPADALAKAAMGSSGGEGLQKKAEALVNAINSSAGDLENLAKKVIDQFNTVKGHYETLMEEAEKIKQESHASVKVVKREYTALKGIYERILNLTKIAYYSGKIKEAAATTLEALQGPATTLESNVKALRNEAGSSNNYENVQNVIQEFEKVEFAFDELREDEKTSVKDKFEALKTLYNKTFKFTKIKYYSDKLENAASQQTGSTVNPSDVIKNFNALVDSYKALDSTESIAQDEFNELKTVYSDAIYSYKWHLLTMPSMLTNWLNFLTFVILFIVYISGGEQGSVTGYYWVMAISGFVFGINMVLVYAVDYRYLPYYIAGENSFPIVTSAILYFATSIFGNRRKYNSDYVVVLIDISISIAIALVASVLWTKAFWEYRAPKADPDSPKWPVISPVLLVIVGMGLVYSIYPGIAPGMIVPFYLIDKIEMVLLILTTFPPLIFAFTTKYAKNWSPKTKFIWPEGFGGWKQYTDEDKTTTVYGWIWHFFDILAPLQIILAVIFVYSIHYRDSSISRSIVNQPKMSTFLTIIFYMCHEIMLATGFPGLVCNGGVTYVLLPTQWVGALLMVLLAFYSIGYITEYKRHDPSQWPTDGMTLWNALCYWLKMASKITNKNFKQLFTTGLRTDLVPTIQNFMF